MIFALLAIMLELVLVSRWIDQHNNAGGLSLKQNPSFKKFSCFSATFNCYDHFLF